MADDAPPFDYDAALQACLAAQKGTIARHLLANGEKVWVRRAGARNPAWRYRVLGSVAKLLNLGVLTPVPNLGGEAGIRTEAARLTSLAAAGVAVPPLLACNETALMQGDVGVHNLQHEWHLVQTEGPAERLLQLWQLGLDAIAAVHTRGQYLSQCFARNMMYNTIEPHIVFIDFEDDPGQVMPLALCQARDWLCYLQSGARFMENGHIAQQAAQAWQHTLAQEDPAVRAPVAQALRRLRPLRHLQAGFWGNDTLRLAAMARLGHI
nr:hypothetical protein [Neisseria sp. HSC-16F19]